ncbi:hypothetical protein GGS21DRAFT_267022 [Xylaria nigripes]|nr:hypothetical protein GGS21DRAFT_267022 [Xylaria nigripes]
MLPTNGTASLTEEILIVSDASTDRREDEQIANRRLKGKGKAITPDISGNTPASAAASPALTADWTKYGPPESLRYIGKAKSDVVIRIIQESIENVKARVLEEAKAAKQNEEAACKQECEEAERLESGLSSLDEGSAQTDQPDQLAIPKQDGMRIAEMKGIPTELSRRPRKRILGCLFRKINVASECGESSAVGAALHKLPRPSTQVGPTTNIAGKRFIFDLVKKAVGEDTKTSSAAPNRKTAIGCISCFEDFEPEHIVKAPCHEYCKPCFRRLISFACRNEQHWPPRCCLNEIPYKTIILNTDEEQKAEYRTRAMEWNLPLVDRIYCSEPDCNLFIQPVYVIHAQGIARCTEGHYTCVICRNAQHYGDKCPQDRDMIRTNQLAEEEGWKRCYGCHAYVEHLDACQHMTCRCGAEFCYVCGARWRTCECSMTQLETVKRQAEVRRQERLIREAREENEAQEAVRLVEEFENEEALKAKLLLREQALIAEELRQKELEEHNRRESERRRAIMLKFEELRGLFSRLHEMQQAMVRENQAWRGQRAKHKYDEARRRMHDNHELERMFHRAKAEANIIKCEGRLESDLVARAAEEHRIEEQYTAKLHAFWDKKKGGDEKIQEAINHLKWKMDKGFVAWQKWARNELDTYRHHLFEEQAIREELMIYKESRFETRMYEQGIALAARYAAELRWVQEIFEERARLLHELEIKEIGGSEDIDS